MLSVKNLTKVYKLGKGKGAKQVLALNNVSIDFPDRGLVFLLGKSGSGKSTLLNSIGGLDTFDSGEIIIKGKSSKDFKQSDFDSYRNTFIGFIFQEYNILEEFSVGKNLALALELQGKKADKEAVEKLLKDVDLEGYYKRKPNQLSGGQKQRVAIARALIKDPEIIMADEPTGALDSNTGKQVMETLKKLSKTKLVIIVSHDREFAHLYGDRVIELKDGKIINDDTKKEVIAEKSESGVSFIDDKIIHIKKGQKLTKKDLDRINKLLESKTDETDTLISFDAKTNSEVKKTAFITEEGNQEVFKDTQPGDIHQSKYDPKNFKLIRSRLKMKDSIKMGASSLKHKPIRLIFTILLACIAFTMFGVVDTLASFNRATSVRESLEQLNVKSLAITKNYRGMWENYEVAFGSNDLKNFREKFSTYTFEPVVFKGNGFELYNYYMYSSDDSGTIYQTNVSGVMPIDENSLKGLDLELLGEGKLPTSKEEICISNNIANIILKNVSNSSNEGKIEQIGDLIGKELSVSGMSKKTIVGIIKDDTDLSKYEQSETNTHGGTIDSYMQELEVNTIMQHGFVNMCYVTKDCFDEISADYTPSNRYLDYSIDNDGGWGAGIDDFTSIEKVDASKITYLKPGVDQNHLANNQVILSRRMNDNLQITQEEISAGITIYISGEKYEVVGLVDGEKTILSTEFYNSFIGYDYIVSRLGGKEDAKLIDYIEKTKVDKSYAYEVQFAATHLLDNFGTTISGTATILGWVGLALAVFAGLMLMNFIATSITYKKREIGILRAIGARGKDVFAIFFSESFIICLINFVLSAIATVVCCVVINNVLLTQLGFTITLLTFGIRQVLLLFGVSFLVALISSFFPVNKIARKNPIDSINNR